MFDLMRSRAIIRLGKKEIKLHASSEKPRVAALGFSIPFLRGGLFLRLVTGVIFAEPFADDIGDNTSRDGD